MSMLAYMHISPAHSSDLAFFDAVKGEYELTAPYGARRLLRRSNY